MALEDPLNPCDLHSTQKWEVREKERTEGRGGGRGEGEGRRGEEKSGSGGETK